MGRRQAITVVLVTICFVSCGQAKQPERPTPTVSRTVVGEGPRLELNNPYVVASNRNIISGRTDPSATVLVSGTKVAVAADGKFQVHLPSLKKGMNTVVVTATTSAGSTEERFQLVGEE